MDRAWNLKGSWSYFRNQYVQIHCHASVTLPLPSTHWPTRSEPKEIAWREGTVSSVMNHALERNYHSCPSWTSRSYPTPLSFPLASASSKPRMDPRHCMPYGGMEARSYFQNIRHHKTQKRLTFSSGFFKGIFMDWQEVIEEFGHTPRAWHLICHMALFSRPWTFLPLPTWVAEDVSPALTTSCHPSACPFRIPQTSLWPPLAPVSSAVCSRGRGTDFRHPLCFWSKSSSLPRLAALLKTEQTVLNTERGRQGGVGFWDSALNSPLQSYPNWGLMRVPDLMFQNVPELAECSGWDLTLWVLRHDV